MTIIYALRDLPLSTVVGFPHRDRSLPGLNCARCTAWSTTGEFHPSVVLPRSLGKGALETRWPVESDELDCLRTLVRPFVPPSAPLWPGAEMGPLTAKLRRAPDIVNTGVTCIFLRAPLAETLAAEFPALRLAASEVRDGSADRFLEIDAPILAKHGASSIPPGAFPPCPVCGRRAIKRPSLETLDRASLAAASSPVFRSFDCPTNIFAEEGLALRLQALVGAHVRLEEIATE